MGGRTGTTGGDESGAAGPKKGDKPLFEPTNPWNDPDRPGFGPAVDWSRWRAPDDSWGDGGSWDGGGTTAATPTDTPFGVFTHQNEPQYNPPSKATAAPRLRVELERAELLVKLAKRLHLKI